MDKTDQNIWMNINPESLSLVCDRQPFIQSQDASWSIDGLEFTDYDLFVCTGGSAVFTYGDRSYVLSECEGFLAPKCRPLHARLHSRKNFEALAQHFELKLFGDEDFFLNVEYRPLVQFQQWNWLKEIIRHLSNIPSDEFHRLKRHALFYLILSEFLFESCLRFKQSGNPANRIVLEILAGIDKRFDEDISIETLFKESIYSQDYTSRLFKAKVGKSPKQYLMYRRLQKSKDCLARGCSVKETAYKVGFKDELYFSRVFRKHEGIPPKEYRRIHVSASTGLL